MTQAEAACGIAVQNQIAPALEAAVSKVLGHHPQPRFEFLIDSISNSPVLLFHYPTIQTTGFNYLKRSVKLEFGSLTDQQPTGQHKVCPWIADLYPDAFTDWSCNVVALELQRSFWEKATILHSEYHRPEERPTPDRFSRHYADTAALANHPVTIETLGDHELCSRVVQWKRQFFGSSWANYDLAKSGSFRLVPPLGRMTSLRRDYQAMREMYLSEPAGFDEVIATLADLEKRMNKAAIQ